MNTRDARQRWQNAFIYGLVTTIMVLGGASAVSYAFGQAQRDLVARVDNNAAIAVQESKQTRELICGLLIHSQTPQVKRAAERYCGPILPPNP